MIPGQKKGHVRQVEPSGETAIDRIKDLFGKSDMSLDLKKTMRLELLLNDERFSVEKVKDALYNMYARLFGIPDDIDGQTYMEAANRAMSREEMGLLRDAKDDTIVYLYNRRALESQYSHLSEREAKYNRWTSLLDREEQAKRDREWKRLHMDDDE